VLGVNHDTVAGPSGEEIAQVVEAATDQAVAVGAMAAERRPPTSRIATQRITGVDEKRRLVCALSSSGAYFADSTNSIQPLEGVNPLLILGILNSRLLNWRFDLTSTNNNVGTNELEALPFPNALDESIAKQIERVAKALTDNGGVKVKDSFRAADLQKLDELVFSLFGLTQAEVETVKRRKSIE